MLFYGWGIYGQMVTQWFQWSFFSSRVYVVELSSSPIKSRMMHIRREGAVNIPPPQNEGSVCHTPTFYIVRPPPLLYIQIPNFHPKKIEAILRNLE